MKLANTYTALSGVTKGQAATGTTDTDCLDIRAVDSGGVQRDIAQVVSTDANATATVISRRLVNTLGDKYINLTTRTHSINPGANYYGFYNTTTAGFYFSADIVIKNIAATCQLFEMYISSTTFCRIGLEHYSGQTGLVLYLASRYNSSSSSEINSSDSANGFLQLNTKYRVTCGLTTGGTAYIQAFTLADDGTATQIFYITGARQRCYGSGGGTRLFSSYNIANRGFIGEVYNFSVGGFNTAGTTYDYGDYFLENSTVGSTALIASNVQGTSPNLTSPVAVRQDGTVEWVE